MFEILVYLFENYFVAEEFVSPDQDSLAVKLTAAGFESDEISQALDWLSVLEDFAKGENPPAWSATRSVRLYSDLEMRRLDTEGRGFLEFLSLAGVLQPVEREWVIDRVLALPDEEIFLDQIKWTVLMVLWSQGRTKDPIFLEDLLFGESPAKLH
ncbi:MAG: DUF494 domain-containing protein [Betaproteobacteria bacterium]|nr:DUF494 domain-containing protein [Betaproteobacteria bacterium]